MLKTSVRCRLAKMSEIDWQFTMFWCLITSLLACKYFDVIFLSQKSGHAFHNRKEIFCWRRKQSGETQSGGEKSQAWWLSEGGDMGHQCSFRGSFRGTSLVAQRVKRLPTMQETRVRSLGQEDSLEKEMATHSSTLAWKITWTEKPGRLQSMGLQRVGHDWATSLHFTGFS